MTAARKNLISLVDTKYYHCISRCVRRAFLCGKDKFTGQSFEHRRQWIEDKIFFLSRVFCIDICAFAVMHNHMHIIFHVDDNKAKKLSDKEVLQRWHQLFKGTLLTQRYLAAEEYEFDEIQQATLNETIELYRNRLFDISWFMRILNEDIARRANKEDDCKGRFWEGRFKSQALLDDAALMACMAYVDLNPVRAQMAKTPEQSEYTSIKKRIESAKKGKQPSNLLKFANSADADKGLPFDIANYLELVDLTGRRIRNDKAGYIDNSRPILARINISAENWLELTTEFTRVFHGAVGREKMLQSYCNHLNRQRRTNLSQSQRLLG